MIHDAPGAVAQRDAAHKTTKIPQLRPLLAPLSLKGYAVTLDARTIKRVRILQGYQIPGRREYWERLR